MPHPTTLMKITTRCGEQAISELNEALLARAVEARVLKTNRVRADTTVVEANVAYPTDSSLLAKGISRIASAAKKLHGLGYATRTRMVDRTRSAHKRARSINANLRRRNDDKLAEVKRINGDLAGLAGRVARDAERVVRNARRRLRSQGTDASGKARALVDRLEHLAERTAKVAAQCRQRISGATPDGATRVVSLHDPDARPIAKGRLGKPVEFGYKAQLVDNEDGVILDHNIEAGNPPDAPMLEPAIQRIKHRTGRAPRAVTADRGYGEQGVEDAIRAAWSPPRRAPPQRPTNRRAPRNRTTTSVQEDGPMAHRLRRTNQLRQTRLRPQPHPHRRTPRRPNLVRARNLQPQPRQDRRAPPITRRPGQSTLRTIPRNRTPSPTTQTPLTAQAHSSGRSSYARSAIFGARSSMDRASDYGSEGWGFDSLRAR